MRIIHVVRQYAPSVGGLETVVARLAHEQKYRFGHDVEVVTLNRLFSKPDQILAKSDEIDGIAVRRLPWRGSSRYPLCPSVLGAIAQANLVHVHGIDFFYDFLAATRWLHRKPLVASTHGGFFHSTFASTAKRVWFQTISRLSSRGYFRIVATSDNDGAVFARIARSRVTVVENGADIALYRDAASIEETRTLIYFGRWSINKGLPALITLIAALRRQNAKWKLIIAGRPYDFKRGDLAALADQHDVASAIELHESPSNEVLRRLMGRASYFACLSRHEGFGIAAVEAMSAGLVPLLSDIPPFRKIVEASGVGVILPSDDAPSAAAAIDALHGDKPKRDRQASITFTGRYEWPLVAEKYETVYKAVSVSSASPAH